MREVIGEGETRKKPLLEYDRYEHTGGLKMKTVIIVILSVLSTTAIAELQLEALYPPVHHFKSAGEISQEFREREARIRQMQLQNRQLQLQNQQIQQMQLQIQQMQKQK